MSPPAGQIRLYREEDERPVRFMIGKAKMEGLATANKKATIHPVTLSIWVGLATLLAEYMQWWPKPEQGMLRYLSPLPAFACALAPIIAVIDWINRPQFEDLAQETLKWPDIPDLLGYYGRSPSGFWVLEYNDNPVGIAAIDASPNAEAETAPSSGHENSDGSSETAALRHFYVDEPYRKADIQRDLLQHVIRHTFTTDTKVQRVKATCSSLTSYLERALKEEGFTLESAEQSLGIFRWKTGVWVLKRARYEKE
ncbi:hypothetical protein PQX77_000559 [Marasmius sp. AFHP31]|nr:hypothetical protein PQX77_000559 [Marasmius sp. AFHP31]